jgi:hypothetical protein
MSRRVAKHAGGQGDDPARGNASSWISEWAASTAQSRPHSVRDACKEHGVDRDAFIAASRQTAEDVMA